MILKARGPGKFCSSRTAGAKVGKIDNFFSEKCPLVRYSSIFWALPGAHAPGKVHSPPKAGRNRKFRKLYDLFLHVLLFDVFSESFVDSQKTKFVIILECCINFFWKRFVCFRDSVGFGAVLEFRF